MHNLQIERLAWACRRGMLELDILLQNFLTKQLLALPFEKRQSFERLLQCTDHQLYAWLLGYEVAPDEFKEIIHAIKNNSLQSI